MILSYPLRLLCLCAGLLTPLWVLCDFVLWMAAPRLQRRLARKPADAESTILFCLQAAPLAVSLGLTLTVCIPAYLAGERNRDVEKVGGLAAWIATLALLPIALGCYRGLRALIRTHRLAAACKGEMCLLTVNGRKFRLSVIEGAGPAMSVVGLLRPTILVSRKLLESFSEQELEIALAHEQAHSLRRDNFKRLLVHAMPSFLLFSARRSSLQRAWSHALEYSADQYAVTRATLPRERALRGLTLAGVLVAVAKESSRLNAPFASALSNSPEQHLCQRIQRLLDAGSGAATGSSVSISLASTLFLSFCLSLAAGIFCATTGSLPVQELMEHFLHL